MKDLSIISVNWNSVDYLRKCLATIHAHTKGIHFEVIVVDNSASGSAAQIIKAEFPDTIIVPTEENVGFARANNLGFEHSSGKNILFLNPDTEIVGPAIPAMLAQLNSLPDAGVVGCKLLNSDLTIQTSCIQRFPTILNQIFGIEWLRLRWPQWRFWGIQPLFAKSEAPATVEVVSGACLIVKRDVFQKAGLFTPEYFMYAEDADLCYKVRQLGLKCYYVGTATIIHHGGGSSNRSRVNQWAVVHQRRAIQKFLQKTRGSAYAACYRVAMGISAMLRLMVIFLLLPFRTVLSEERGWNLTLEKWTAVLKWAAGVGRVDQPVKSSL